MLVKCDIWYHTSCMFMTTPEYIHLANTSKVWICSASNTPHSSKIYNSISVEDSSYSSLSTTNSEAPCSPCSSIGSQCATSSLIKDPAPPKAQKRKTLRLISLDFQSIKNKVLEIEVLVENSEPDSIVGTETWLNNIIFSAELLPSTYNIIRRDRVDSYGGSLMGVKNDFVCTPTCKSTLISTQAKCQQSSPTYRVNVEFNSLWTHPHGEQDTGIVLQKQPFSCTTVQNNPRSRRPRGSANRLINTTT